jgi:chorismate mutase/prephenate dehydratase
MTNRSLDDLRREIDEIDDAIHDLIMKRADVVQHVGAAKKSQTALPIRPSREAFMLRRLSGRHKGPFQLSALARMWHEMIAAFTMIQASYKIAVFSDTSHHTLWDLARDQFGSQVPMTAFETRREVLQQVMNGQADVGVLPPPEEDDDHPWWTQLAVPGAPVIVQRMPFAGVGNVRGVPAEAVAIARLEPEPTGDDVSFLVFATADPVSRSTLVSKMKEASLPGVLLASLEQNGEWMHLAQVADFVAAEDERVTKFVKAGPAVAARVIGAYAMPIAGATKPGGVDTGE